MSTPPSTVKIPTIVELLQKNIVRPAVSHFGEFANFSPVIFTLGSLYVAAVTLNYPILIFSLASGEAFLIKYILSGISNFLATSDTVQVDAGAECKSIYEGSISTKFKHLLQNGVGTTFPNSPLYFISFAAAYCIQSMLYYSEECSKRGPAYSSRPYIAYIMAALIIILFSLYTLMYNCDSTFSIMMSVITGLIVGFMLCYQNLLVFGKEGIAMLFIPPLVQRNGLDYICVSTN